jgi:hypothetical protein
VFMRRPMPKSHAQMVRDELGESYGHFKVAASHAPGGATELITPPYDKARDMASRRWQQGTAIVIPVYETMKDGARNARSAAETRLSKENGRSTLPALIALLAAGIALGAVGALIARRRRAAQEWDEFEPERELGADTGENARSKAAAATQKVAAGAKSMAGNVSGKLAGSLRSKSGSESEGTPFSDFAADNPTAEDIAFRDQQP